MQQKEWFSSWFDTKYYTLLYRNRNDDEAKEFVRQLMKYYKPKKNTEMLDMGCGRGRFARFLHEYEMKVTGMDISPQLIKKATVASPSEIEFVAHDIRKPFGKLEYDFIFSFFTSFGYFDTDEEHLLTLQNVYEALKIHGIFLIDYLNADRISLNLPQKSEVTIENIHFSLHKYFKNGYFVKEIQVDDHGRIYNYVEKVRAFSLRDFKNLFSRLGLQITACFGDYDLSSFDILQSRRLIIACVKR